MAIAGREKKRYVIAGAGPAGSSLAIRLAAAGCDVRLLERAEFPRHKLCGEFISPECLEHFAELGVIDGMLAAGGDRITKTVFYSMSGKSAEVPSKWFGAGPSALGLSRAAMDDVLLKRAESLGVHVSQGSAAAGLVTDGERIVGLKVRNGSGADVVEGDVFIDATGRQRVLSRMLSKRRNGSARSGLVGFKAHLSGVGLEKGRCEIYFFPGGYGGLSYVEDGAANHCFLVRAAAAREHGADADRITRELIFRNPRARAALSGAERRFDWLAVAVDGFGTQDLNPAPNLFTVGDAGAFIDPFTGSGMLMALESAELLSGCLTIGADVTEYSHLHRSRFRKRLLLCSMMRRLSFRPAISSVAVTTAGLSSVLRKMVARRTRGGLSEPRF